MPHDDWRPGKDKLAHGFQIAFCDDPGCGLHIVALNPDDSPICEIVMSPKQTLRVIEVCKGYLYEKAAKREK
jgi:hypothetical protein